MQEGALGWHSLWGMCIHRIYYLELFVHGSDCAAVLVPSGVVGYWFWQGCCQVLEAGAVLLFAIFTLVPFFRVGAGCPGIPVFTSWWTLQFCSMVPLY